ncbi:MAG: hypothetical protein CM15mV3_0190 [Caudoviricetes sp.]|nr:MAG: hypothetical protein CM15mV3_0190 [Caudoviricetes sp.]
MIKPISLPHLVAREPQFSPGYCACAQVRDSDIMYALLSAISCPAL